MIVLNDSTDSTKAEMLAALAASRQVAISDWQRKDLPWFTSMMRREIRGYELWAWGVFFMWVGGTAVGIVFQIFRLAS
jgi:hypothetical protein